MLEDSTTNHTSTCGVSLNYLMSNTQRLWSMITAKYVAETLHPKSASTIATPQKKSEGCCVITATPHSDL